MLFYISKNPQSVMGNVKQLMHTRDPGGFLNPYWIVNFHEEVIDKNKGCGFVVGRWYAYNYKNRASWEDVIENNLHRFADNAVVFYMVDGKWTTTVNYSEMLKSIEQLCE